MSSKRRKDPPPSDDLLRPGDIFADLVDAPSEPSRPGARGKDPIRIQVTEGDDSPLAALTQPDALPEDVAKLLDSITASPPPPPRKPEVPPPALEMEGILAEAAGAGEGLKLVESQAEEPPVLRKTGPKFQITDAPTKEGPGQGLDLAAVAEGAFSGPAEQRKPSWRSDVYGPYRLLDRVAVGGMAEVFKAKRSGVAGFEKTVAVKRILPHLSENREFVDMFVNEAKMVAGLTHPNIVQIHDLGKIDKSYYIAMEYVHGRDLRTILKRTREKGLRIPLDLSLRIVGQVCAALDYAHRKRDDRGRSMRIVHRDVSPQNILISFDGNVKLADFGIAKAATKASSTDRGALRGKLLYMSPEQAWGKPIDLRSDLFSLGLVLYEMITDAKPFMSSPAGGTEMSILETVRQCRIAPPRTLNPRIPESLERIAMKALEADPDQRYQDAAEWGRALERFLREQHPLAGDELARFLELLFDREEREEAIPEDLTPSDSLPRVPETDLPPGEGGKTPSEPGSEISVDTLLKRFGIK